MYKIAQFRHLDYEKINDIIMVIRILFNQQQLNQTR